MNIITVKEVMSPHPLMVDPGVTVKDAALLMKENDCGVLPVGTPEAVLGVITDRDIVVRVIAEGKDAATVTVSDVMTRKHIVCNEQDDVVHAAELMRKHDVSRVLVANFNTITGIVTIADLVRNKGDKRTGDHVLHELLRPAASSPTLSLKTANRT